MHMKDTLISRKIVAPVFLLIKNDVPIWQCEYICSVFTSLLTKTHIYWPNKYKSMLPAEKYNDVHYIIISKEKVFSQDLICTQELMLKRYG